MASRLIDGQPQVEAHALAINQWVVRLHQFPFQQFLSSFIIFLKERIKENYDGIF
jgi:hypothetical protein